MTALAAAGIYGLAAVVVFALAAIATISRRPFPSIAPALAVAALILTVAMVLCALGGLLVLIIGALS